MWLAHHGILGMKWGVRRYQNKDGSLTAAGYKRYNIDPLKTKNEKLKAAYEVYRNLNWFWYQGYFDELKTTKTDDKIIKKLEYKAMKIFTEEFNKELKETLVKDFVEGVLEKKNNMDEDYFYNKLKLDDNFPSLKDYNRD